MKANKWTTLSSETSPSWIFKQHWPRQQCWRSSSCGPTVSANTTRMVRWATRSTTLTSGDPYHTDGERTKLMKTRSPRCTRHPCASRAPSGSIFSSWRKYCPKTTITFMMHCLMETRYWTQEPRQLWFQGRHHWTSKEHAQHLRIRTWCYHMTKCDRTVPLWVYCSRSSQSDTAIKGIVLNSHY